MKTFITHSPQETEELAGKLAALLSPGDIIAYEGGMGMGKSAFTRGLCRGLGIAADVSSPTFSLVNEYRGENATLYHFDMFRVESFSDLYSTGFFDYLDYGGILAIEWSENIAGALPEGCIQVSLERVDDTTRKITIKGDERLEAALA